MKLFWVLVICSVAIAEQGKGDRALTSGEKQAQLEVIGREDRSLSEKYGNPLDGGEQERAAEQDPETQRAPRNAGFQGKDQQHRIQRDTFHQGQNQRVHRQTDQAKQGTLAGQGQSIDQGQLQTDGSKQISKRATAEDQGQQTQGTGFHELFVRINRDINDEPGEDLAAPNQDQSKPTMAEESQGEQRQRRNVGHQQIQSNQQGLHRQMRDIGHGQGLRNVGTQNRQTREALNEVSQLGDDVWKQEHQGVVRQTRGVGHGEMIDSKMSEQSQQRQIRDVGHQRIQGQVHRRVQRDEEMSENQGRTFVEVGSRERQTRNVGHQQVTQNVQEQGQHRHIRNVEQQHQRISVGAHGFDPKTRHARNVGHQAMRNIQGRHQRDVGLEEQGQESDQGQRNQRDIMNRAEEEQQQAEQSQNGQQHFDQGARNQRDTQGQAMHQTRGTQIRAQRYASLGLERHQRGTGQGIDESQASDQGQPQEGRVQRDTFKQGQDQGKNQRVQRNAGEGQTADQGQKRLNEGLENQQESVRNRRETSDQQTNDQGMGIGGNQGTIE